MFELRRRRFDVCENLNLTGGAAQVTAPGKVWITSPTVRLTSTVVPAATEPPYNHATDVKVKVNTTC